MKMLASYFNLLVRSNPNLYFRKEYNLFQMDRTSDFLEAVRKEKHNLNVKVSTEDIIQPRPQLDPFLVESYALVCLLLKG